MRNELNFLAFWAVNDRLEPERMMRRGRHLSGRNYVFPSDRTMKKNRLSFWKAVSW